MSSQTYEVVITRSEKFIIHVEIDDAETAFGVGKRIADDWPASDDAPNVWPNEIKDHQYLPDKIEVRELHD